jgi:hypothetical protein
LALAEEVVVASEAAGADLWSRELEVVVVVEGEGLEVVVVVVVAVEAGRAEAAAGAAVGLGDCAHRASARVQQHTADKNTQPQIQNLPQRPHLHPAFTKKQDKLTKMRSERAAKLLLWPTVVPSFIRIEFVRTSTRQHIRQICAAPTSAAATGAAVATACVPPFIVPLIASTTRGGGDWSGVTHSRGFGRRWSGLAFAVALGFACMNMDKEWGSDETSWRRER